jgi:NGP1NT (NUC091) domain
LSNAQFADPTPCNAVAAMPRDGCVTGRFFAQVNDSYTVLLREKKLPMSLLEDPAKKARVGGGAGGHLLATQVGF